MCLLCLSSSPSLGPHAATARHLETYLSEAGGVVCIGGEKDRSGIVDSDSIEHSEHRGLRKGRGDKGGRRRQGRHGEGKESIGERKGRQWRASMESRGQQQR